MGVENMNLGEILKALRLYKEMSVGREWNAKNQR